MSKRKIELKQIKRRVNDIKKDKEVTKVMLNDKYLFATWDYNMEEVINPIKELDHIPLWDWFNILNMKTNKLWYVDFTCPYIDEYWETNPEHMKISSACIDFYYNIDENVKKLSLNSLNKKDNDFDKKREWYEKYNNWKLTFENYIKKNEANKLWNEGIKVISQSEKRNFNIIVPYEYAKGDMSITDILREGVNQIINGKIIPKNQNEKYFSLINEIKYEMFLYDRKKSTEMFI